MLNKCFKKILLAPSEEGKAVRRKMGSKVAISWAPGADGGDLGYGC